MSKSVNQRPRLGRGLSSLISVTELPVEAAVPPAGSPPAKPPTPVPAGASRPNTGESGAVSPPGGLPDPTAKAGLNPASAPADSDNGARSTADLDSAPRGTSTPAATRLIELPIDSIVPNPHQPRRQMNESALRELAESIKASGLIQPIIVRRVADGPIQLIAGERRWRASKLAGLATIPALVREVDVYSQAQMALIENIQREDLNPIDRALGYQALMNGLGLSQAEVAGRLGEERATISHFTRLLELAAPVQEAVRDGRLSLGHAKLLAGVADLQEQQRLSQMVLAQSLSVRNLEKLVNGSGSRAVNRGKIAAGNSMHLADLERNITRQLGMRVNVKANASKKGNGRIVIHYANLDQFDDLMGRLAIKLDE